MKRCGICGRRLFWWRRLDVRFIFSIANPRVTCEGAYCSWRCVEEAKTAARLGMSL